MFLPVRDSADDEVVRADGLAAVRLRALGRLVDEPVAPHVEPLEGVARRVALGALDGGLDLAADQQHLAFLSHDRSLSAPLDAAVTGIIAPLREPVQARG